MNEDAQTRQQALSNMTKEVAYRGALRHFVDEEYTVREIAETLSYPVSYEDVKKEVYLYMKESGMLQDTEPSSNEQVRTDFVMDEDSFGRKTYRRVTIPVASDGRNYLPVVFGSLDKDIQREVLKLLPRDAREYMEGIDWPAHTVYLRAGERISSFIKKVEEAIDKVEII